MTHRSNCDPESFGAYFRRCSECSALHRSLSASHDWVLEETPVENVLAMFDTIEEHGRYA